MLRGAAGNGKLKLGLISAATYGYMGAPRTSGSNHGTAFATACNGYDEAKRKEFQGTFVAAKKRIEGAQVVKIWDPVKSAAEKLAAIWRQAYFSPTLIGVLYAAAGETEKALEWLEKGYEIKEGNMPYLGGEGIVQSLLRDDPRFQDLLRRMNLPAGDKK